MAISILRTADLLASATDTIDCTGADILVVGIASQNAGTNNELTAITYNGVAMTEAVRVEQTLLSRQDNEYAHIYYLVNPASGSNTLSATTADGTPSILMYSWVLSGVDTTNPLGDTGSETATGGDSLAVANLTVVDDSIVVAIGDSQAGIDTFGNLTEETYPDSGLTYGGFAAANSGIVTAGTRDYSWTINNSRFTWVAAEFKAAAGGGATGTNVQLNIADSWRTVDAVKINVGDSWREVTSMSLNVGDSWKTIY